MNTDARSSPPPAAEPPALRLLERPARTLRPGPQAAAAAPPLAGWRSQLERLAELIVPAR